MLSAYEESRLRSIAENKAKLIALGLETAAEQCRHKKPPSFSGKKRKAPEPPTLTDEQRAALSKANQWLERFEVWLRGEVSQSNADKTMERVRDLVSGAGVHLKGYGTAFAGRPISISDDLVELKADAAMQFGAKGNGRDQGGWHLNHPIGKMLKFQQVLFSSSSSSSVAPAVSAMMAGGSAEASVVGASVVGARDDNTGAGAIPRWLSEGAEIEVDMREDGFWGSRYTATVVSVHAAQKTASVRYEHLTTSEAHGSERLVEEKPLSHLRPRPPRIRGFECKLRRGASCELWHLDGWWEVTVFAVHGGGATSGGKGASSKSSKEEAAPALFDVFSEQYGEIDRTVDASMLRPKLVLVHDTHWLALAPFGFKCEVGSVSYAVDDKTSRQRGSYPANEGAGTQPQDTGLSKHVGRIVERRAPSRSTRHSR
jgi:hypothetical protein